MEYLQYKYNSLYLEYEEVYVLNLVISGIPSILNNLKEMIEFAEKVLNLVISGIPSIQSSSWTCLQKLGKGFKPCYKWNTFNTFALNTVFSVVLMVLNLVISGIPSIQGVLDLSP